jgi:cell division protein FtsB
MEALERRVADLEQNTARLTEITEQLIEEVANLTDSTREALRLIQEDSRSRGRGLLSRLRGR